MPVEHRVDELAALPPVFAGNRHPLIRGEEAIELVVGREPREAVEQTDGTPVFFSEQSAAPRICSPIAMVRRRVPCAAISSDEMPPSVVGVNSSGMCPSSEPERSGRNEGSRPNASMMSRSSSRSPGREMAARKHVDARRIARRPLQAASQPASPTMRVDGLRPAILECVLEVRRRDVDERQLRRVRAGSGG